MIIFNVLQCISDFPGKNFLRAGQMNTNVATWARLLKRAAPTNCTTNNTALSPNAQPPLTE